MSAVPQAPVSPREAGTVLLAAAAIRIAYILFFAQSPFFAAPILDSAFHDAMARSIAEGNLSAGAPYFRPPLFPWALGALYAVVGAGPWPGRALNAGLGVATALAVLALGARLGLSRPLRLGAAVAAAAAAPGVFFEGELLGEPLATALGAWGLVALLGAVDPAGRGRYRGWIWMSLLWSLAALGRGPLAVLVAVGLLYAARTRGQRVRRVVLVAALAAAVWSVPAAIQAAHGGGFRFPASQAGINLYVGNYPGADGRSVRVPGLPEGSGWQDFAEASVRLAQDRSGRALDAAGASDYWTREALRFWVAHPGEAMLLTLRKALFLIHGFEIPNNRSLYLAREDVPWFSALLWKRPGLYWPSGLLLPLALAGLVAMRDRRWRPVAAYGGALLLPLLAFFVCARFRAPAIPALALLAASGARALWARRRSAWAVFLAAYLLANLPWAAVTREDPARDRLARAEALFNAARLDEAAREYARVLALDPAEGRGHQGLAAVAERRGDLDTALDEIRLAASLLPDSWSVHWTWARILDRQGHTEAAVPHLEVSVRAYPENPELHAALGLTLEALRRDEDASAALEEALRRGSGDAEAWNSAGRYRRLRGDRAGALAAWDRALQLDPRHFKALFNRGLARAETGEKERALLDLEAALAAASSPAEGLRARQAAELLRSQLP